MMTGGEQIGESGVKLRHGRYGYVSEQGRNASSVKSSTGLQYGLREHVSISPQVLKDDR